MIDRHALLAHLSPEKRTLLLRRLRQQQAPIDEPARSAPLVPDPAGRHDSFPLTDLQRAYWLGRTDALELGNLASRGYLEIDCADLDLERLERGWQRLIERHDILRAVVSDDGRQRVLREVPAYRILVNNLDGLEASAKVSQLDAAFRQMTSRLRSAAEWPLFDLRAYRLDARCTRLHIALDLLNVDGGSMALLFRELATLLRDPAAVLPPLELTFRDYVLACQGLDQTKTFERAREYWMGRLTTLAGHPDLPMASKPIRNCVPRFSRRTARLDVTVTSGLKECAARLGVTLSAICLLVYAEVLAAWSSNRRFTINIPILNRLPLHPQVHEVAGVFTSVLLFEVDLTGSRLFADQVKRVQTQLLDDLAHSSFDGVAVQRELARLRGPAGAVMPVVLTSLLDHRFGESVGRLGTFVRGLNQTAQVWMDLHVDEEDGRLVLHWDAVDALFPDGMVVDMLDACVRRLAHVAFEDGLAIREDFPFAPASQLEQRRTVNSITAPVPDLLLHAPFIERARERPAQTAVVAGSRRITYDELFRHANRLGQYLRTLGVRPNTLVAVVMEKGWEQIVAALGILQSGAAFLPIDAAWPSERLRYVLEHGEVQIALTQPWLDEALEWPAGVRRFHVDTETLAGASDAPIDPVQGPGDLAYVIFTSGSTGLPKGVMIDHRGALNTVLDINRRFAVGPDDRVCALSSLSFDLSVYDIFGVLAAGGSIVVPDPTRLRDPAHWLELLARERITIWNSVPGLMAMLVEYAADRPEGLPGSMRLALLSGDWIPVTLPDRLRAVAPGIQVIGLGGATEASIWSILFPIGAVDPTWKSIPYGRPMANQGFHVLDEALEPRPVWVPGHLYIGGIGLAQGYWRDEEKTRAAFIVHPRTAERLYRTGDLGRYQPDGNIEFLGRDDTQVKIQGYRVELGEIEAALAQHPGVKAAVAVALGEPRGKKQLVAYVVPRHAPAPTVEDLRRFVSRKLPDYMVPTAFLSLDSLPLSDNGKVDRRALPDPQNLEAPGSVDAPSPTIVPLVERIVEVVRGILRVDRVDAGTNLLNCGATSIDLVRIGNQLEKTFGDRPSMEELFRRQTPRDLAAYYAERQQPHPAASNGAALALIDPVARAAFRDGQPGLRRPEGAGPPIPLTASHVDGMLARGYLARRSHRAFSLSPVPLEKLSGLLECLKPIALDGHPKYLYGSAGGLYPNQVYVHAKPGRLDGVPAGTYYYHPVEHRLVPLTPGVELDRNIHVPFVNQPIFEQAAFSLFIVAQLAAIVPEYGDWSLHFATIEAGLMTQLLETTAAEHGLGLCQIGSIEFDRVRSFFDLDDSHRLIHSMVGGTIESEEGLL